MTVSPNDVKVMAEINRLIGLSAIEFELQKPVSAERLGLMKTDFYRLIKEEKARRKAQHRRDTIARHSEHFINEGVTILGLPPRRSRGFQPIECMPGKMDIMSMQAEKCLLDGEYPVYARGAELVQPIETVVSASGGRETVAASLVKITPASMALFLSHAVEFQKWSNKTEQMIECDVPETVISALVNRGGRWALPTIAGVITCPTIRPDGSIVDRPGYDASTRLYYAADPRLKMPPVIEKPTHEDAVRAKNVLVDLMQGFPFVAEGDQSVALSGMISPVVRGALGAVPLHAIRATCAGSGKSFLIDLFSTILSGRTCPAMTVDSKEEETDKRLVAKLLQAMPILNMDNCNGELGGDLICQAIERPIISVRPLGSSSIIDIENRTCLYATGNALRVRGDMVRRSLVCNLDPHTERPELRKFAFDPVKIASKSRGEFVAACLTIVRAYIMAGMPDKADRLGSFGNWSDIVRSALIWVGCADPCESMEQAREDDPILSKIHALMVAIRSIVFTDDLSSNPWQKTVAEIVEMANETFIEGRYRHEALRAAVLDIAGDKFDNINRKSLGHFIDGQKNRISGGMKFSKVLNKSTMKPLTRNGAAVWELIVL